MRMLPAARNAAALSLGGLAALHALWATGSAWPAPDRATLADAVGGFSKLPGPGPCLGVATLLALAAACVRSLPTAMPEPAARLGSAATCLVLVARAAAGLTGRMPHARRSAAFARLDRRVYSPACLVIGLMASAGLQRKQTRFGGADYSM